MKWRPRTLLLAAAALAGPALATPASAGGFVAVQGGTVHIRPGQVMADATVLVGNGRIVKVGQRLRLPAGTRIVDAQGLVVTAGFVDASTDLGLREIGHGVPAAVEGQFPHGEDEIHAAYRVIDGYNQTSAYIPIARSGGITSVISVPRGGLVAGTSAWFSLAEGLRPTPWLKAPAAMYASLGRAIAEESVPGGESAAPKSRGAALERLRELLADAAQFPRRRSSYERNQTRPFAAGRLDLQAMEPVLRRQIPLVVRVDRSSDILATLRLGREFAIKLVIEGGVEAWRVADLLAAAKVAVILNPIENLPEDFDRLYVRDDAPARLAAAGVPVVLSTLGDGSAARTLRQLAGNAIANGLAPRAALAAVTTVPAEIFGLSNRGALVPGAAADLVVWSGDPFELSTRAVHVFIDGIEQSLESHQTLLFRRYRTMPGATGATGVKEAPGGS